MSLPPVPPPLEQLGHRPFSFYPAILNVEHNEWLYRRATWSEVLVQNTKTNEEIWVPRRFFGEISLVSDRPRTATVTTTAPGRLLVVTDRAFRELMRKLPSIQLKVLTALADRLAADAA